MDADKLIEAFTEVVQKQDYVFLPSAMEDIPSLGITLAELDNKSLESRPYGEVKSQKSKVKSKNPIIQLARVN